MQHSPLTESKQDGIIQTKWKDMGKTKQNKTRDSAVEQ